MLNRLDGGAGAASAGPIMADALRNLSGLGNACSFFEGMHHESATSHAT
jgi:hypothetical protein